MIEILLGINVNPIQSLVATLMSLRIARTEAYGHWDNTSRSMRFRFSTFIKVKGSVRADSAKYSNDPPATSQFPAQFLGLKSDFKPAPDGFLDAGASLIDERRLAENPDENVVIGAYEDKNSSQWTKVIESASNVDPSMMGKRLVYRIQAATPSYLRSILTEGIAPSAATFKSDPGRNTFNVVFSDDHPDSLVWQEMYTGFQSNENPPQRKYIVLTVIDSTGLKGDDGDGPGMGGDVVTFPAIPANRILRLYFADPKPKDQRFPFQSFSAAEARKIFGVSLLSH